MKRATLSFAVLLILVLMESRSGLAMDFVRVPPVIGDTYSLLPFALKVSGLDSMRYQQVFTSEPFMAFNSKGVLIQRIGFSANYSYSGPFSSSQPSFQMNLSTTTRGPDNLSLMFSENVGADDTVVFGPGPLDWPSECCGSFLYSVDLDTPFYYYPAQGNGAFLSQ
jgi:hypothetical protein